MFKHLLVPVDGSDISKKSLKKVATFLSDFLLISEPSTGTNKCLNIPISFKLATNLLFPS